MDDLILSIIVPCYNVSDYLERCVNSLIQQNYKNIEILLIDDGSTDNTSVICDKLAVKDNRIRVIHQKNMGISATREKGIKNSKHQFVTFVDSDDWIHPDMYVHLMKAMIKENVDIAQCGFCKVSPDGKIEHRYQDFYNNKYEIYSHDEGVIKIIEDKEWGSYMWNKIYRKDVFKNITFPIGRGLGEDISIMHEIFNNAKSSIYFKDEYYYYYYYSNSICHNNNIESIAKRSIDHVNAQLDRYKFLLKHPEYNIVLPHLKNNVLYVCLSSLKLSLILTSYFPKEYFRELRKEVLSISLSSIEQDTTIITKKNRFELTILRFSSFLFRNMIKLNHKLTKNESDFC